MAVAVEIKRHPGKLSLYASGRTPDFGVGEVYIDGAFNRQKAAWLNGRGTDPMFVPDNIKRLAREYIKVGIRSMNEQTGRRTTTAAAQMIAKWIRERITTGGLGTNARSTVMHKIWLCSVGLATTQYGVPPPYGVQTGRMVHSIKGRWRAGRGSR